MIIRPMTPDDLEAVGRVHVASWRAGFIQAMPPHVLAELKEVDFVDRWRKHLVQPGRTNLLCEVEQTAAGFVAFGANRDEATPALQTGEVYAIYLAPEFWNRGLGQALLARAHADLRASGFTDVTLWVLTRNDRARRFYEIAGYSLDGGEKVVKDCACDLPHIRYRRDL